MLTDIKDIISLATETPICEEFDCRIILRHEGKAYPCYSVYVSPRELSFYSDKAVLNYAINLIGFEYSLVLNEIIEE